MELATILSQEANIGLNGLASPALIRGSADLSTYPGVTLGALANNTERTANGAAIVACRDWCISNSKYLEAPPGLYQFLIEAQQGSQNVGLQIPHTIPGFIGGGAHQDDGTRFVQYATNQPVVTIGDVGASASNNHSNAKFGDFVLGYGASQSAQTSAIGLLIGRVWNSTFGDIMFDRFAAGGGAIDPFIGVQIGLSVSQYFFQNRLGLFRINGAQQNYLRHLANSTGNKWSGLYVGAGTFGSRIQLTQAPIHLVTGSTEFGSIDQMNVEWSIPGEHWPAIFVQMGQLNIDLLHVEGCKSYGFDVPIMNVNTGQVNIRMMSILDHWINSTDATGTPCIFKLDGGGQIGFTSVLCENFRARWQGSGVNSEAVASTAFRMVTPTANVGEKVNFRVGQMQMDGHTGAFSLDSTLTGAAPGSAGAILSVGQYDFNKTRSTTQGAVIEARNADLTVYAAHRNAQVRLTQVLTADRKLILSNNMASSGIGNVAARLPGDIINAVRTSAATGAFNWNVRNSADDTTVASLTTANTEASALLDSSGAWDAS